MSDQRLAPDDLLAFKTFCEAQGFQDAPRKPPNQNSRIVVDLFMTSGIDSFLLCHAPNSKSSTCRGDKYQKRIGNLLISDFAAARNTEAQK